MPRKSTPDALYARGQETGFWSLLRREAQLSAGAARNAAAGMLPTAATPRARQKLLQIVEPITITKGLAAARKASVLG